MRFWVNKFIEVGGTEHAATPRKFVAELSCFKLANDLIFNNFANISVPAPATERTVIERVAKDSFKPFTINSLPKFFEEHHLIRGRVYSQHVWEVLDELAMRTNVYWWYSEAGLGMAQLTQLFSLAVFLGELILFRVGNRTEAQMDTPAVPESASVRDFRTVSPLQEADMPKLWRCAFCEQDLFLADVYLHFQQVHASQCS